MKFKIEKNIKIINELIAYFYKFGTTDVHIDLNSDSNLVSTFPAFVILI